MATGPWHYQKAEQCIGWARGETDRDKRASLHARAQVHATLALAIATALSSRERDGDHDTSGMDPDDRTAWEHVAAEGLAEGGVTR